MKKILLAFGHSQARANAACQSHWASHHFVSAQIRTRRVPCVCPCQGFAVISKPFILEALLVITLALPHELPAICVRVCFFHLCMLFGYSRKISFNRAFHLQQGTGSKSHLPPYWVISVILIKAFNYQCQGFASGVIFTLVYNSGTGNIVVS